MPSLEIELPVTLAYVVGEVIVVHPDSAGCHCFVPCFGSLNHGYAATRNIDAAVAYGPIKRDVFSLFTNRVEYGPRVVVSRLAVIRLKNDAARQRPPIPIAQVKSTVLGSFLPGPWW